MIPTTQTWKIGDCLQLLPEIPDKSIDMILTDLPYGTTQNKWDSVIPLNLLWLQYARIITNNGIVCLTSCEPFTNKLINSKPEKMKYYDLVWDKKSTTGFLNANKQPLRRHEQILCFYIEQPTYNPLKETRGEPRNKGSYNKKKGDGDMCYGVFKNISSFNNEYFPTSIIQISNAMQAKKIHPTEKPLDLFEYLIKTYTNEGDTVHDSCLGSGTTLEACANLNRNCIGFELLHDWEEHYRKRLRLDTTKLDNCNVDSHGVS